MTCVLACHIFINRIISVMVALSGAPTFINLGVFVMKSKNLRLLGCVSVPLMAVAIGAAVSSANGFSILNPLIALDDPYTIVLDNSNSPVLNNGNGSITDSKGVVWEYSNASNMLNGHVSLLNQGYFGVSALSPYGITGVETFDINFSSSNVNNELHLQLSYDGTHWEFFGEVTSQSSPVFCEGYRYLRFFAYTENNSSIDITSLSVEYSCSGTSGLEDVDLARDTNVYYQKTSNFTVTSETDFFYGSSTNAVRIANTTATSYGQNHQWVISLGKEYNYSSIKDKYLSFTYLWKERQPKCGSGPSVQLFRNNYAPDGLTAVKIENYAVVDGDWWVVRIPVSEMVDESLFDTTKLLNGLSFQDYNIYQSTSEEINEGKGLAVIDQLRICGVEQPELLVDQNQLDLELNSSHIVSLTGIAGDVSVSSAISSNTSVATIDEDTLEIEAVGVGETTITITARVGPVTGITAQIAVSVFDPASKYNSGNRAVASNFSAINDAHVTFENVHSDLYGDGVKVTVTDSIAESTSVFRINLGTPFGLKANANAHFTMTTYYGLTKGSYTHSTGYRSQLVNSSFARKSNTDVQEQNLSSTASGNNDGFYVVSNTISAFGASSSCSDSDTVQYLEVKFRPGANANDVMYFYNVVFYDIDL